MADHFTNYSMGYYLEGTDIAHLLANYREAYKQHFQQQFQNFTVPALAQIDDSFWHNKDGELVFYAGEVAILDSSRQKADQTLGRNLRNADLAVVSKLLAMNVSVLPFDSLHIIALMNWNKGHWTSVVLSLKNINKEKYAAIHSEYEAFQKWIGAKKEETRFALKSTITSDQPPVPDTLYFENYYPGAVFPLSDLRKNANGLPCLDEVFVDKHKVGNKTKLKYVVLDPKDKSKIIETVTDIDIDEKAELNLAFLQKLKPQILAEASKKGYTSAAKLKYFTVDDAGMVFENNLETELEGNLTVAFLEKNKNKIFNEVLSPKSLTNIQVFLQYATGYYDKENFSKKYIGKWIQAYYKEHPKEKDQNNNLKLILEPQDSKDNCLIHFDSMLPKSDQNIKDLSNDFLTENKIQVILPTKTKQQSGATCGEHALLNALRYALLNLNNVISSDDLRTATNYFCVEFAKLFLFDYNHKTYTDTYNYILACQQAKSTRLLQNEPQAQTQIQSSVSTVVIDLPKETETKEPAMSPGGYVALGMLCGGGVTLFSMFALAPLFGIVNPVSIGLFTSVVLLVSTGVGALITDSSEISEEPKTSEVSNISEEPKSSKEQEILRKQSLQNTPANSLPVPPKTFTPQAKATAATSTAQQSTTTPKPAKNNLAASSGV